MSFLKINKPLIISSLFLSASLVSSVSFADVCHAAIHVGNKYIGNTSCRSGEVSNINVLGTLSTSGTVISDGAKVVGAAVFSGGSVRNADITGDGNFNGITLSGTTKLTGRLKANNVSFSGPLNVYSPDIHLIGTNTKDIQDMDLSSSSDNIYLQGSHVNGNITFNSGKGVVYVDSGSSISGSVMGGKVVHN